RRLDFARSLVQSNPDSGSAWYLLARSIDNNQPTTERAVALKRAAELSPDDPSVLNSLATEYAKQQKYEDALMPATSALKFAPWNAGVVDTYATVLAGLGRCAEAVTMQWRAVEMTRNYQGQWSENQRKQFEERLMQYRQNCTEKR